MNAFCKNLPRYFNISNSSQFKIPNNFCLSCKLEKCFALDEKCTCTVHVDVDVRVQYVIM